MKWNCELSGSFYGTLLVTSDTSGALFLSETRQSRRNRCNYFATPTAIRFRFSSKSTEPKTAAPSNNNNNPESIGVHAKSHPFESIVLLGHPVLE